MVRDFDLDAAVDELLTDEGRDYGYGVCDMTPAQRAALMLMLVRLN